jgi:hypothetical protein
VEALRQGLVIIARGTTNAFVAEEITGIKIASKSDEYSRGCIVHGELRVNVKPAVELAIVNDFVLRNGKIQQVRPKDAVKEFTANDVFIKGANAVDSTGAAGVLTAGNEGGTIGSALPVLVARGSHLIVPAGLEKLIPSVTAAIQKCSVLRFKFSNGRHCALFPRINGKAVTEVQALKILTGVDATLVASGGIGGSEGSVVLSLGGSDAAIDAAFGLIESIKGEPSLLPPVKTSPRPRSLLQ